jgi:hypothetical protein
MADKKITGLTELTSVADTDLMHIVDVSEAVAANRNKKVTIDTLKAVFVGSGTNPSGITAWNSGTTYDTADKPIFVSHADVIWEFVKISGTSLNNEPGTDDTIWERRTVADLAIYRTGDTIADDNAFFYFYNTDEDSWLEINPTDTLLKVAFSDKWCEYTPEGINFERDDGYITQFLFESATENKTIYIPELGNSVTAYMLATENSGQYRIPFFKNSANKLITTSSGFYYQSDVLNVFSVIVSNSTASTDRFTGALTVMGGLGVEKQINSINNTQQTLTDAATVTWNAQSGHIGYVALGGDRTLALPTNVLSGNTYKFIALASGADRTLSFTTGYRDIDGAAASVVIPSGDKLIGEVYYDGTSYLLNWIIVDI